MKISDLPTHSRPREKLIEKGITGLTSAEVFALILRTGYHGKSAVEVAQRILRTYTLEQLSKLSLTELSEIKGIGPSRASNLMAAFEIGRLIINYDHQVRISAPKDIYQLCQNLLAKKQEHLVAFYLDARSQLIAQETLTVGTLTSGIVHSREVFAPALRHRAACIILAHNHPSQDTEPSLDDIQATEKLIDAGDLLDIPIIDHVIVSRRGWTSLREQKLI
ncbi:MAG TPA: DNA repair protein RadC [Vitreimonas sp.]|nr:DNA repair protein RadC [Vitreimonas sp.]